MTQVGDLPTPALIIHAPTFQENVATMAAALPGPAVRPHVKAFKSTALARELVAAGHHNFCAATGRELVGMAGAGMGTDLLLANEALDVSALGELVATDQARVTVAVDSVETLAVAVRDGIREVLIDVNVGLPRCGCLPDEAGRLAEQARGQGLEVRGVMGYEGHLMMVLDRAEQAEKVEESMALLLRAHDEVGGDVVSGGGTGTYATNTWCTEIQAGSYTLMDSQYETQAVPFRPALFLLSSIISVSDKWAVGDAGLKAQGMDHGDPTWPQGRVLFCSDEHVTIRSESNTSVSVGDRVTLIPAHVDPTVAKHEVMYVVDGLSPDAQVIDTWPVDLRHW
ncbi:MAG: metal-activated pyridoxal enzyme [Actinomycetia bacterium]|nr:metal-activated pyridoxal enzyme [Actinomycetes bacterium]MCP4087399.1 metal-activated pyridoxal enzyme [Actinomycetes bacterium]